MGDTPLTPLALAALSILTERPAHPYEIHRVMLLRREDRFVRLRPASLYRAVEKLRDLGCVEEVGTDRDGNRPERTTYRVTEDGVRRLRHELATTIEQPVYEYPRFPVALGELDSFDAAEAADLLQARIARLDEEIAANEAGLRHMDDLHVPRRYRLDEEYVQSMLTAERRHLAELCDQIVRGEIDWEALPPGLATDALPDHASDHWTGTPMRPTPSVPRELRPPRRPVTNVSERTSS